MDEVFIVQGLAGEKTLSGSVSVSGSKNAVLPMLAATFLFEDKVVLENVPDIEDVRRTKELLEDLGVSIVGKGHGSYEIDTGGLTQAQLTTDIAKRMRASVIFTGPLLTRFGEVSFPHPGGCVIGKRPIDLFLESFEAMGGDVEIGEESYVVTAKNGLFGADIFLRVPSVTVTETLIMAGVLADGTTTIRNAAMEPEVTGVAEFLKDCGAKISGVGTPVVTVEGTGMLSTKGKVFKTIPDRLEAGSFLVMGALCAHDLAIENCEPEHLHSLIAILRESGVPIEVGKDTLTISGNTRPNSRFQSFDIKTHEYPGFPTDLQAPAVVFLTQASGESHIFETIFEGRLQYIHDLVWMDADIELLDQHRCLIRGPRTLRARPLKSPDIRAGLAFVIAAAIAKGTSRIHDVYLIDRGYERVEEKLRGLGLEIERTSAMGA